MRENLKGQVAIVTGAGSATGIGFAIARGLLQDDALVVITATSERIRDRAKELDATGRRVLSFVADLTDEQQVEEFVHAVTNRFRRIDILVNNAGMAKSGKQPGSGNLETLRFAEWQEQLSMTLNTAFLMTRAPVRATPPANELRRCRSTCARSYSAGICCSSALARSAPTPRTTRPGIVALISSKGSAIAAPAIRRAIF